MDSGGGVSGGGVDSGGGGLRGRWTWRGRRWGVTLAGVDSGGEVHSVVG